MFRATGSGDLLFMRALVVSDIHGNLHALQAVLQAGGSFDELWNLGDAVGYGAHPNEVIDILKTRATINVRGNHDRVCSGLSDAENFNPVAAQAAAWTRHALSPENLAWLRAVPMGPIATGDHAECAHGSPLHEDQYILSMRDAWTPLQRMASRITFFGHTHIQGAFAQQGAEWEEVHPVLDAKGTSRLALHPEARYLVNPGSVGQPRDRDARAAFAVYDDAAGIVLFRRVPYDVTAAQADIRAAGLPERLASRLETGR
jgi:diadenosine tetraphosphatase ApaH/serine/threonine PP2A family protein phosphatase